MRVKDIYFTKPVLHSSLGFWFCSTYRESKPGLHGRFVGQGRTPKGAWDEMKMEIVRAYRRIGEAVEFVNG